MEGLISFIAAGIALIGSPGPATLSIAATGAAFGARQGLRFYGGILIGTTIVMGLVAAGVVGLLLALPGVAPAMTLLAGAYFLYLAWRIATAPALAEHDTTRRPPSFAGGIFLSLVNPKAYAAMAALFSGFVLIGEAVVLDAAAKMAVLIAIVGTLDIGWLFAGAALTRWFRNPVASRLINVTFAVLLVASLALVLAI
ncbi:LysE family translocator [Afifella pfennigii]|uniref:LysE family translocator n=1 Tax=Afifella pfennigii TaxID=209897 RepID=UPI00047BEAC4|nr:LysE family translocator [Afifella pfennigii]